MNGAPLTSAKIYTFPAGGRGGLAAAGQSHSSTAQLDAAKSALPVLSATGWYHDAAVREALRGLPMVPSRTQ